MPSKLVLFDCNVGPKLNSSILSELGNSDITIFKELAFGSRIGNVDDNIGRGLLSKGAELPVLLSVGVAWVEGGAVVELVWIPPTS